MTHLARQLRQKPARFIRSMFWTSVRRRRCSMSPRKAAASTSVLVLSSIPRSFEVASFPRGGRAVRTGGATGSRSSSAGGAPADVAAAETLRPVDAIHGLIGPRLRLGDAGGARRDSEHPTAVGDD